MGRKGLSLDFVEDRFGNRVDRLLTAVKKVEFVNLSQEDGTKQLRKLARKVVSVVNTANLPDRLLERKLKIFVENSLVHAYGKYRTPNATDLNVTIFEILEEYHSKLNDIWENDQALEELETEYQSSENVMNGAKLIAFHPEYANNMSHELKVRNWNEFKQDLQQLQGMYAKYLTSGGLFTRMMRVLVTDYQATLDEIRAAKQADNPEKYTAFLAKKERRKLAKKNAKAKKGPKPEKAPKPQKGPKPEKAPKPQKGPKHENTAKTEKHAEHKKGPGETPKAHVRVEGTTKTHAQVQGGAKATVTALKKVESVVDKTVEKEIEKVRRHELPPGPQAIPA